MLECANCHYASIPEGMRFCPNCGQALPASTGKTTILQVTQDIKEVAAGAQVTGASIGKVEGNLIIAADEAAQARERRNLRILLEKVQNYWVKGVLEGALAGARLIEIDKLPLPGQVDNPLQISDQPTAGGPLKTSQVFEENQRALLIMDGAGSGKTVSLLTLACDLAERAGQDPLQPVPVILNLASWSRNQPSLADWAVEEINLLYQIPTKIGRQWLENGALALLLDGLDEVEPGHLPACVEAINRFRQEFGLLALAVCCRTDAYQAVSARLRLGGAAALQPLNDEQVEQYLVSLELGSQAIRQVLRDDENLRSLAHSPLMLQTLRLAYQGLPAGSLSGPQLDDPGERRLLLVKTFVERAFSGGGGETVGPVQRERVTHLLAWLAKNLRSQNASGFWIEQLQPGWLARPVQRWVYYLLSRGLVGLMIGVVLAGTAEVAGTPAGRAVYLLACALAGLLIGALDAFRAASPRFRGLPGSAWLSQAVYSLAVGLIAGGVVWWSFARVLALGPESLRLAGGIALAFGLAMGVAGWQPDARVDIRAAEALTWSFRESRRGILPGLLLAVGAVLVTGLIFARSNPLGVWLPFGGVYGVLAWLGMVVIFGLRGKQVERKSYPNQGTWLSARNALRAGLVIGIGAGLIYALRYGLLPGAVVAARAGSLAFLIYGAYDALKHLCLRLVLSLFARIPWRLARVLDAGARLGLLLKAGGGYLFANHLLQDFFSNPGPSPDPHP